MTIESQILDQITALLGRKTLSQTEFANWYGGAANGGPNHDGLFPLTDGSGYVQMVPSPAKQMSQVGASGTITSTGWSGLPAGTSAELSKQVMEVLAVASPGAAPKRVSPYYFTQTKTADRDVLQGSDIAQWIDGLSSSGTEVKIPYGDFQKQFGGVIDPSRPPYNVVYDYKKQKDIRFNSGTNLYTSGVATFVASDVGKLAVVGNAGPDNVVEGYIGQVVDSKNIRLYLDKAFTQPANCTATMPQQVGWNGAEMVWGTDNTVGLQAAFDAAEPVSTTTPGATVVIGGVALARQLRFGSISVVGLADTTCGFAALPIKSATEPFFADKNTGVYATLKPDGYTIKNLTFFGQQYTQAWSAYRNTFEIRGGQFGNFRRGAPYARIDNIDVFESQTNGIVTNGAFAGQFNNIRSMNNALCGMRMGFWDLNGTNWHVEANGGAGVLSYMSGANVAAVRASYNGSSGGSIYLAGAYWPHEMGANWTEIGYGNTITNLRMQESWGHSLCFSSTDPLAYTKSGGNKNAFFLGTFDDTGNIVPAHAGSATRQPGVRAMVYCKGGSTINNTVDLVTGSPQVSTRNFATNAYWDEGNPSGNKVTIRTPGITNATADWSAGGAVSGFTTTTAATAPGPWGTSSASSIATRGNVVTINGAVAP